MRILRIIVCLALLAAFVLTQSFSESRAQENSNVLAVGKSATVKSKVAIKPVLPISLNYLTREDILAKRSAEVMKYPMLMRSKYTPFHPIWGAIEDKKPWWGLAGAAVFDSGEKSMLGLSEESRFLMNPYMLVGANPNTTGIWNPSHFTNKEIMDPTFPYFWLPESIYIDPARSLGAVSYNLTDFQKAIQSTGKLKGPVQTNRFSLVAYNARDMGYNFILFKADKSIHITSDNPATDPVFIRQMLHCGGTCGCRTTCCNNMSPFMPEIDRMRISRLPARATVYLWKEDPGDASTPPDMVFLLEFH